MEFGEDSVFRIGELSPSALPPDSSSLPSQQIRTLASLLFAPISEIEKLEETNVPFSGSSLGCHGRSEENMVDATSEGRENVCSDSDHPSGSLNESNHVSPFVAPTDGYSSRSDVQSATDSRTGDLIEILTADGGHGRYRNQRGESSSNQNSLSNSDNNWDAKALREQTNTDSGRGVQFEPHIALRNADNLKESEGSEETIEDRIIRRPNYTIGGDMTVHTALRERASKEEVLDIINRFPNACHARDREGNLPLHVAATYVTTVEIFHALLDRFPDGIRCANKHQQLPLHRACALNRAVQVVSLLIRIYSHALRLPDDEGNLPIHYATAFNSVFILKLCVKNEKHTQAVAAQNNLGFLPLHMAALHNSTCDNARVLIRCDPYGLHVRSEYGDLPVHLAIKYNVNQEVVKFLAWHSPDGLLSNLPIHCLLGMRLTTKNALAHQWFPNVSQRKQFYKGARRIHICGDTLSGKSVLAYWLHLKLSKSAKKGPRGGTRGSGGSGGGTSANSTHYDDVRSAIRRSLPWGCGARATEQVKLSILQRTEGVSIKRIHFVDWKNSQRVDYTLYDYGGGSEHLINHASYLSVSDSVYVIVLPLYNIVEHRQYSFDELLEQYLRWLRLIYSVAYSYDQMSEEASVGSADGDAGTSRESKLGRRKASYDNFRESPFSNRDLGSKGASSRDFRLRTLYQNDSSTSKGNGAQEVVYIPIITVINTFSQYTRSHINASELQTLQSMLLQRARELFHDDEPAREKQPKATLSASGSHHVSSPAKSAPAPYTDTSMEEVHGLGESTSSGGEKTRSEANRQTTLNVPIYEKRMHFCEPVVCNIEDKLCLQSLLPVLSSTTNYAFAKVSSGLKYACLYLEKSFEKSPLPLIMKLSNFVENLRTRLDKYSLMATMHSLEGGVFRIVRDVLSDSVMTSFRRNGRILVVSSSSFSKSETWRGLSEDVVITDPFYVSNGIFNAVLSKIVEAPRQHAPSDLKAYILSRQEIDTVKGGYGTSKYARGPNFVANRSLPGPHNDDKTYNVDADNSLLDELSATQLLEVARLIVPVRFDSEYNTLQCTGQLNTKASVGVRGQARNFGGQEGLPGRDVGPDHDHFLLFGLIPTVAPENVLHEHLLSNHTTVVSSLFLLVKPRYDLIPGFYMKLFYFLLQKERFKANKAHFYKNALALEIHRPLTSAGSSGRSSREPSNSALSSLATLAAPPNVSTEHVPIAYTKQIIVCPASHAGREGFQVVLGIAAGVCAPAAISAMSDGSPCKTSSHGDSLPRFVFSEKLDSAGYYNTTQFPTGFDPISRQPFVVDSNDAQSHRMALERDIASLRKFLHSQIWNIELTEVPLQCEREGDYKVVPPATGTYFEQQASPPPARDADTFVVSSMSDEPVIIDI